MDPITINRFPIWQPVVVDEPLAESDIAQWAFRLGEWADRLLYLGTEELQVKAEVLHFSCTFEQNPSSEVPLWQTAAKIALWITSCVILPLVSPYFLAVPAIALAMKLGYKSYLNGWIEKPEVINEPITERKVGETTIALLAGSVTEETTDVIVNAANTRLWAGTGVCGAIRQAAGKAIFDECQAILNLQDKVEIQPGEAVLTSSGQLYPRIQAIIHAAGPDCRNAEEAAQREELLAQAYTNSLALLISPEEKQGWVSPTYKAKSLQSIAFPPISTGIFGYNVTEAAPVAVKAVVKFIEAHPGKIQSIRFICLPADKDPKTINAYKQAIEQLK